MRAVACLLLGCGDLLHLQGDELVHPAALLALALILHQALRFSLHTALFPCLVPLQRYALPLPSRRRALSTEIFCDAGPSLQPAHSSLPMLSALAAVCIAFAQPAQSSLYRDIL